MAQCLRVIWEVRCDHQRAQERKERGEQFASNFSITLLSENDAVPPVFHAASDRAVVSLRSREASSARAACLTVPSDCPDEIPVTSDLSSFQQTNETEQLIPIDEENIEFHQNTESAEPESNISEVTKENLCKKLDALQEKIQNQCRSARENVTLASPKKQHTGTSDDNARDALPSSTECVQCEFSDDQRGRTAIADSSRRCHEEERRKERDKRSAPLPRRFQPERTARK